MLPYFVGLRFKQGEIAASNKLPEQIRSNFTPYFIIPPPKEADKEAEGGLKLPYIEDKIAYSIGEKIGKYWHSLPGFIDTRFGSEYLNQEDIAQVFVQAQHRNPNLAPVVSSAQLSNRFYQSFVNPARSGLGIRVDYDDIDVGDILTRIHTLNCSPEDCVIFIDFTGANITPELATGSVTGIIDDLGDAAAWRRIVPQFSDFPLANPAKPDSSVFIPRDGWKTFLASLNECSVPKNTLGYGDFGADCGHFKFPKKSGGKAIRHLRYTTETDTLVQRGPDIGKHAVAMQAVCQKIIENSVYAGSSFSYADRQIMRIANGLETCGNPSNWREWNTAHHITRVVHDLSMMFGTTYETVPKEEYLEQATLFAEKID